MTEMAKLTPDTVRGYRTLGAAKAKTSKLGAKPRELTSLVVAVTTHCDGCIVIHTDAALKAGATREQISEALGAAVAMNGGAALVYSTRVMDAVAAKKSGRPELLGGLPKVGSVDGELFGEQSSTPKLELVPQILVVDLVMMDNFGCFHEGTERARAAICRHLL